MQSYNLTKLSILVLERHLLIRNLLTEVFREFGVSTVMNTPDPNIAWEMFQQFPVDLIMSDWSEGLDGMAFLEQVRQGPESRNPFIPVIVCTANTEYRHVCRARDTGMTDFLAKPVDPDTLYQMLGKYLTETHQATAGLIKEADSIDRGQLSQHLDRLASLLASGDVEASHLFARLAAILKSDWPEDYEILRQEISTFNYDAAFELLQALQEKIA